MIAPLIHLHSFFENSTAAHRASYWEKIRSLAHLHNMIPSWRGNRTIPRQLRVEPYHKLRRKRISRDRRECFLGTEIRAGKQQSEANVPIHIADHECLSRHCCRGKDAKARSNAANCEQQHGNDYPRTDLR